MGKVRLAALLALAAAPLAFVAPAAGQDRPQVVNYFYVDVSDFTWKEFLPGGFKVLEESGPLYGLGWLGQFSLPSRAVLRARLDLTFGQVDYDGNAQFAGSPVLIPIRTDVTYFFWNVQGDVGYRIGRDRSFVAPFIGLGVLAWNRDIDDTTAIDNGVVVPVMGYQEDWGSLYTKLGLHGMHFFSPAAAVYGEAGMLYPLYTVNQVSILGDLRLEPKGRPSVFAEVGASYGRLRVALFYEGLRFRQSDVETTCLIFTCVSAFQPESESDVFGLRVGFTLMPGSGVPPGREVR